MRTPGGIAFCLSIIFITPWAAAQSPKPRSNDVTIIGLDGSRVKAELNSISVTEIGFTSADGKSKMSRQSIKSIQFGEPTKSELDKARSKAPIKVELRDGSSIRATEIAGATDQWDVTTLHGLMKLPVDTLSVVQFRPLDDKETQAWEAAKREARVADEIVISRGAGNVDRASGVIGAITKESVSFDFEGQTINAPRAKLVGAIWLRKPLERFQPAARVVLLDGTVLLAAKIEWGEDRGVSVLRGETSNGILWNCPAQQVYEIDLSSANVKWLASLDVLDRKSANRIATQSAIAIRDKLFGPRFVNTQNGLDQVDQDLVFASPGEITFRVPEGFQYFVSKVGRRSEGDARSLVSVEIWQAEERIFAGELPDELDDISVKVSVTPGKRLRILVSSDSSLAAGTKVQWTQPRFER
jgi:NPCBM/NEW2 domain